MSPQLEVAVFSQASALLAQRLGASRVELNAPGSYPAGGLTPPLDIVSSLSPQLTIPLRLMIRPRGPPVNDEPDFIYTEQEFEQMKRDVIEFKEKRALKLERGDGFVFGIVTNKDDAIEIDEERCAELVQVASPFTCVFHRAFDFIAAGPSWESGLRSLERCGFQGLLTAGGTGGICDNLDHFAHLEAVTELPELIGGGGLRADKVDGDIQRLARRDRVWLHTAALSPRGENHSSDDSNGDVDEGQLTSLIKAINAP